ncbi:MAG TPA: restriction endonuclease [Candidatus Thermoplasmatota archaeon]|nr:restriction endonuclease [Candidatus Thermoplasmatota archaeon]
MRAFMVRAGNDNELADLLEKRAHVALGWSEVPSVAGLTEWDDFTALIRKSYPEDGPKSIGISVGQLYRFAVEMEKGDMVLSYHKASREYLVGRVEGEYRHDPSIFGANYPHVRRVVWRGRVARDRLSLDARNTLGSTLTVFSIGGHWAEFERLLGGVADVPVAAPEVAPERRPYHQEVGEQARALIGDMLDGIDPYDFQDLVAAVLRAMGYRTRVSPKGADGGVDIRASPDSILVTDPSIYVQVKHRRGAAGSPEIQQFESALGAHARGLFVSTGGFSVQARVAAEKAHKRMTLFDDEQFIGLLTEYYEKLEPEYQRMVPLQKIWVPVVEQ